VYVAGGSVNRVKDGGESERGVVVVGSLTLTQNQQLLHILEARSVEYIDVSHELGR
jgi:uncharacterized protein YgbK (DUF1537 family)